MDGALLRDRQRAAARVAAPVAALALLYFRHGSPARAMALGLAAMRMSPPEARLVLLVSAAFLRTGDAEKALAVLDRLDGGRDTFGNLRLAAPPSADEQDAAEMLRAKALLHLGDREGAALAMERARRAPRPEGDPA